MEQINASIDVDRRLWPHDIAGSKAHCEMLVRQKIIAKDDGAAILRGLEQIAGEMAAGTFAYKRELEDIHMNIEGRLHEIIGETAGKLHTARSRNDQVATAFRLWCREAAQALTAKIAALQTTLNALSKMHEAAVMPGFTHLQPAQPVTLGLHLDAYAQMLERDKSRLDAAAARLNYCPLGAAAMAGTPFPIDREMTAKALGFAAPVPNTMDAVADRDFAAELLFCCGAERHASVQTGRGDYTLGDAAIRLYHAERPLEHRLFDHAAEEKPGRSRTGARQNRAAARQSGAMPDDAQGPAAGL